MAGDCTIRVDGIGFTEQQISECVDRSGLLSIDIELTNAASAGDGAAWYMNDAGLTKQLIGQARDMGAEQVVLMGRAVGSPVMAAVLEHACELEMRIELCVGADEEVLREQAVFFADHRVRLLLETNMGESEALHPAMRMLMEMDYVQRGGWLSVAIRVGRGDAVRLPAAWRWARDRGIEPRLEMEQPVESGRDGGGGCRAAADDLPAALEMLERIDREEYGRKWGGDPLHIARSCNRHQYSCYVSARGGVHSCAGLTIPLGVLSEQSLRAILESSEVVENLRAYKTMVKLPCGNCDKAGGCYGCRGAAYRLTGDYLSPDPVCRRVRSCEVEWLPHEAEGLIPHGPSMRMVDRLLEIGEREIHTECVVGRDWPFVDADGQLDELAYIEVIAQSLAASRGFQVPGERRERGKGLLLGVRGLKIYQRARSGQRLHTRIRKVARLGDFGIAEGQIRDEDNVLLATGEVKVWTSSRNPEELL